MVRVLSVGMVGVLLEVEERCGGLSTSLRTIGLSIASVEMTISLFR